MVIRLLSGLLVGLVAGAAHAPERTADKIRSELSLAVAPSDTGCILSLSGHQPLRVVLTNVSAHPLKIWKESNSWGYYALRFEVTHKGETKVIRKKERGWRKNAPTFHLLESGKSLDYNVFLGGDTWENLPFNALGEKVEVKAIFEIIEDVEARKLGAWTGRISSSIQSCLLRD